MDIYIVYGILNHCNYYCIDIIEAFPTLKQAEKKCLEILDTHNHKYKELRWEKTELGDNNYRVCR